MVTVWGSALCCIGKRGLTKRGETIQKGMPVGELLNWVREDENRRKGKWY